MSKVADYLNEHILGEVTTSDAIRQKFSTDASVLSMTPEMIVYPRTTNDLRKVARFSWQLAEKGHVLPITTRGGGSDQTGAAIGTGIVLNTTAHLNALFELDSKQKLVRVQPGMMFRGLNDSLLLQGMFIPSYPASANYSTIGGAIANNASGILSGKYGATGSWVHQIEVVLANGDVLQTGRISKRELNRKKGLQTFEGEIYRSIDNLIQDNRELIDSQISVDLRDNAGYTGIVDVKRKDGSIDLMPLFVGSQGTLGIISEVIMKTEFVNTQTSAVALAFDTYDAARDALDAIRPLGPSILEVIDARLFESALDRGKKYAFYDTALENGKVGAIIVVGFDDFSDRVRNKRIKKIVKTLSEGATYVSPPADAIESNELLVLRDVSTLSLDPVGAGESAPPLLDGAYIPQERFEDFATAVEELGKKYHLELPIYGRALEGIYYIRPTFQLHKIGDKQNLFKLLGDYANMVDAHKGHLIGEAGEGRLKAPFAYKHLDDDVKALYESIKLIFDPQLLMNPGVKQAGELKPLIAALRTDYSLANFSNYSPSN